MIPSYCDPTVVSPSLLNRVGAGAFCDNLERSEPVVLNTGQVWVQGPRPALPLAVTVGLPRCSRLRVTDPAPPCLGLSQEERTALHWAAENGHRDCVEVLLDKGANAEATDKVCRTPTPMHPLLLGPQSARSLSIAARK